MVSDLPLLSSYFLAGHPRWHATCPVPRLLVSIVHATSWAMGYVCFVLWQHPLLLPTHVRAWNPSPTVLFYWAMCGQWYQPLFGQLVSYYGIA